MKYISVKRCLQHYFKTKEKLREYPISCVGSDSTQECTQDSMTIKLQSIASKALKKNYKFVDCANRQYVTGSHMDNVNKEVFVPQAIFVIDMDQIFGKLYQNEQIAMYKYAMDNKLSALESLDCGDNNPEEEFYIALNTLKEYLEEAEYIWTKEDLLKLKETCGS
jgi:hypothetical protein